MKTIMVDTMKQRILDSLQHLKLSKDLLLVKFCLSTFLFIEEVEASILTFYVMESLL